MAVGRRGRCVPTGETSWPVPGGGVWMWAGGGEGKLPRVRREERVWFYRDGRYRFLRRETEFREWP